MKGKVLMKTKTVGTSATLDTETIELMDYYLNTSGVKTAMMMYNAMELYKNVGCTFEVYKIKDGQIKRFRAFQETIEEVYEMAKKKKVNNNVIWNQIIKDYVICKLHR